MKILHTLLALASLVSPAIYSRPVQEPKLSIIWDLGDVVVTTSTGTIIMQAGPWKLARYVAYHLNGLPFITDYIKQKSLYRLLHATKPRTSTMSKAQDGKGNVLPALMIDWLSGTMSGTEIIEHINTFADNNPRHFRNDAEKEYTLRALNSIFDPELFVKSRILNPRAVALIKRYKKEGHKQYILSNWDPASFKLMQQQHPDFFGLFDGIVISGTIGRTLKPDPAIYQHTLKTFALDPAKSVFVDDQKVNVIPARKAGIHGVVCTKTLLGSPDIDRVATKIDRLQQRLASATTLSVAS